MNDFERRLAKLEQPFVKSDDGAWGRAIHEEGRRSLNADGRRRGIFPEDRPDDQELTVAEWSAVVQAQQAELLSRAPLFDRPSGYDG